MVSVNSQLDSPGYDRQLDSRSMPKLPNGPKEKVLRNHALNSSATSTTATGCRLPHLLSQRVVFAFGRLEKILTDAHRSHRVWLVKYVGTAPAFPVTCWYPLVPCHNQVVTKHKHQGCTSSKLRWMVLHKPLFMFWSLIKLWFESRSHDASSTTALCCCLPSRT